MNKKVILLALLAGVASGVPGVLAPTPSAAGQTEIAAQTGAASSTSQGATTLRVRGTIDKYDPLTRTLVLSTPDGTVKFPIAAATRIRQGGQNVDLRELPNLAGDHATVRYTESDGKKIVESVHVFGK